MNEGNERLYSVFEVFAVDEARFESWRREDSMEVKIQRDTCDEKVLRVVGYRSGMFMQIRVLADRNGIQRKIRFTY